MAQFDHNLPARAEQALSAIHQAAGTLPQVSARAGHAISSPPHIDAGELERISHVLQHFEVLVQSLEEMQKANPADHRATAILAQLANPNSSVVHVSQLLARLLPLFGEGVSAHIILIRFQALHEQALTTKPPVSETTSEAAATRIAHGSLALLNDPQCHVELEQALGPHKAAQVRAQLSPKAPGESATGAWRIMAVTDKAGQPVGSGSTPEEVTRSQLAYIIASGGNISTTTVALAKPILQGNGAINNPGFLDVYAQGREVEQSDIDNLPTGPALYGLPPVAKASASGSPIPCKAPPASTSASRPQP